MEDTGKYLKAAGVLLMTVGVLFLLVKIVERFERLATSSEIRLPLLVITGIVGLLAALTLAAVAFRIVDLSNRDHALGLPEGSVRAVIALALLLIFAIVSIFLYNNLSAGGDLRTLTGLTRLEVLAFQQAAGRPGSRIEIVRVTPALDPNATGPFTVLYASGAGSQDAVDFAKQLLTLLGTLVTSVCSFYFGSRAATSAQASGIEAMRAAAQAVAQGTFDLPGASTSNFAITSVNPSFFARGTEPVKVSIDGTGLDRTSTVQLTKEALTPISGKILQKAASSLACEFVLGPDTQADAWDLVVTGSGGESARQAIKVI